MAFIESLIQDHVDPNGLQKWRAADGIPDLDMEPHAQTPNEVIGL